LQQNLPYRSTVYRYFGSWNNFLKEANLSPARKHFKGYKKDLTGKTYGRLTVLYPTNKKSGDNLYWHCKCSCGKETDVLRNNLVQGTTRSCGCLNQEQYIRNFRETWEERRKTGTSMINQREQLSKNNRTGVKGVSPYYSKGVFLGYRAYITYKRKQYYGGIFPTIKETAAARKKLENKYFNTESKDD